MTKTQRLAILALWDLYARELAQYLASTTEENPAGIGALHVAAIGQKLEAHGLKAHTVAFGGAA